MFRWITRRLLAVDPALEVVGEAGHGLETLDVVAQVSPEVVLLDGQMPLLDGIATTTRLRRADPAVPMVLLTGGDEWSNPRSLRRSYHPPLKESL